MKQSPEDKEILQVEHRVGVILEDINSKFDQVLDGHAALKVEIEKVYDEVKETRKEMDWKFSVILEEIKSLKENRMGDLEKRMMKIEQWILSRNS